MLWGALDLLRILMILGGTAFIRTSCFVVENVVPVSLWWSFDSPSVGLLSRPLPFHV